jgi:iron complex transport system substrate-binding protein
VRICSLLPSATEIVADLGLIDSLVGVSEECAWPPEVKGKPVVTAARVDTRRLADAEIDRVVRESVADGSSLYTVDADLIDELKPDVLITQDLCTVCAVSSGDLATACPVGASVISLDPGTIDEIADSVLRLGEEFGAEERARALVDDMRQRIGAVRAGTAGHPRRRVFVAEWIDPPFSAGHWVPEMVEAAGGVEVMGEAGKHSFQTTWDEALARDPELIVIAPCGFLAEEAAERARTAGLDLPCRAVAVDADSYFSRPAPRIAAGVEQLGHLLHPDAVPNPGLEAIEIAPANVHGRH